MLLIVEPEDYDEVAAVASRLDCTDIGETIPGDQYTILWNSEVVVNASPLLETVAHPYTGPQNVRET